ncbi:hypothetical protein KO500_14400 [Cellulophaga baltica]|uniref:hypothetical protein n=1 Tax=Cellulophaga TaxID=104264 RepID=UPI001C077438|nr:MULTISPECIES: hypothetical protein [Cellulophaga]MBU2997637.1 hypothetical protein [Cellulophaga baltica]MDO6769032.1 hypothetical protein [Cellulophaga sp. 1_MG-2023]
MNKIINIILIIIATGLIIYNATILNFDNLFEGDSMVALIGIVAALCAIVLLLIFMISKKIQKKVEDN